MPRPKPSTLPQRLRTTRLAALPSAWLASALLPLAACQTPANGSEAGSSDTAGETGGAACIELADGTCVEETFANPPVLEPDADGVHQLILAATEVELDGERHCVRAYNGAYLGPTLETPARVDGEARQVRVNFGNRMLMHDYQSLEGDCECRDAQGDACLPTHVHDACIPEDDDCVCTDDDGEVCEHMFDFNVSNLHAHGSHVRPDYARGGDACEPVIVDGVTYACRDCDTDEACDSEPGDASCYHGDNVLNALHPGEGAQYRWDIDEDGTHHTGLQWYHPHIHGTTSIQVASGAAGAWIVRGALDALPGIADARERVMVFSTPSIANDNGFAPLAEGETCTDSTLTFNSFKVLGDSTAPQLNLLNGQRRPRMITAPGQVERWRILHAGFLDEVFLGLFRGTDNDCSSFSTADEDTLQLTQIGRDGLILPQTYAGDYVFMSPGYRVEAMLGGEGTLADGETWCLVAARFLQDPDTDNPFLDQPMAPNEAPTVADILSRFDTDGDVIAIMNVSDDAGPATTTTLPDYAAVTALAPSLELGGVDIEQRCADAAAVENPEDIDQAAILQVGFFTVDDPDPCDCAPYNVNCNNFETTDRSVRPFDRDLPLDAIQHWRVAASVDGHPFHIHINPYIVCPADNVFDPLPFPHWRDTYLANLDRKVDIISQNRAFTGGFVFHCHKLTHEDHGMMELIRVCDPSEDPTCGDYDWRACPEGDLQCVKALAATDCALLAKNDVEAAACVNQLGGPFGVCGPNACLVDGDCMAPGQCVDNVCALP